MGLPRKVTLIFFLLYVVTNVTAGDIVPKNPKMKNSRMLPVFQVVRFPNDPCEVTSGSKNGTCYTAEECSNRGGTNAGTCADGFGVCCTFVVGCGATVSENCSYFEVGNSAIQTGRCSTRVCKITNNICQMRLDFDTFIISGPSTSSVTIGHQLAGTLVGVANGKGVADATQCQTDTFNVRNQNTLPVLCATLTGEHVYFDASDLCNDLDFQFGQSAVGLTSVATRQFSIKITQYDCNFSNLAPSGCDQWYYGSGATGYVTSFGYDGSTRHLADQKQTICIRRENNKCRICWSADAKSDVRLSLDTNKNSGIVTGTICCGYGLKGTGIDNKGAYDCLMIPGAITTKSAINPGGSSMCGNNAGLVTKKGDNGSKTLCSKAHPFMITFQSDSYEMSTAAMDEATGTNTGFKLRYFQTNCS